MLLARACGTNLGDHHSVFRTLAWRVHRNWYLAIPGEFRSAVSHEDCILPASSKSPAISACDMFGTLFTVFGAVVPQTTGCNTPIYHSSGAESEAPTATRLKKEQVEGCAPSCVPASRSRASHTTAVQQAAVFLHSSVTWRKTQNTTDGPRDSMTDWGGSWSYANWRSRIGAASNRMDSTRIEPLQIIHRKCNWTEIIAPEVQHKAPFRFPRGFGRVSRCNLCRVDAWCFERVCLFSLLEQILCTCLLESQVQTMVAL